MSLDTVSLHRWASDEFDARVRAVPAERWTARTPCTAWDVRALVNHLVSEQLWVPPLLAGQTLAQVGDRFTGDVLGPDPVAAWGRASAAARAAIEQDGVLERTVHLSYGDAPADHYVQEMSLDLIVHAWDLARGAGLDDQLDPRLVAWADDHVANRSDELTGFAASGLFAPPVTVPTDADPQTRLLARLGRERAPR